MIPLNENAALSPSRSWFTSPEAVEKNKWEGERWVWVRWAESRHEDFYRMTAREVMEYMLPRTGQNHIAGVWLFNSPPPFPEPDVPEPELAYTECTNAIGCIITGPDSHNGHEVLKQINATLKKYFDPKVTA